MCFGVIDLGLDFMIMKKKPVLRLDLLLWRVI